jgi:TRAP-type C4-dicarboxylate transport system permease small subunit
LSELSERATFVGRGLHWIDRVSGVLAVAGGVTTVFLVVLTVVAVFFRYVLNNPIFGVDDLSQVALSVVVAGSIAYGARAGAHVHVDILGRVGGRTVTRYTDVFVRAVGALVVGLTAYGLVDQGLCGMRCGNFTPNLTIPHFPFYMLLAASMAVYSVILAFELVLGLIHFRADEDPNEHR